MLCHSAPTAEGSAVMGGGCKVHARERHAQSGILHADFKAQALALGEIHSEDLAGGKP